MMKSAGGKNIAARYGVATVFAGLGLFFLYETIAKSTTRTQSPLALPTCSAPAESYKLVQIYQGDGELELSMYAFELDAISSGILDHASNLGNMPGASLHQFYAQQLCTSKEGIQQCSGIVLDVGAFIGNHALVLAKMGFDVHAFEVLQPAADLLRCSVVANKFQNLKVIQEGLSNAMGQECLIVPMTALAHQTMVAPKIMTKMGCDPSFKVTVATLDHYWKNVLGSQQILFIKITVEGHEEFVLEGGAEMFKQAPPPYVLVEYVPSRMALKNVTLASFVSRIDSYGYRMHDCKTEVEVPTGQAGVEALMAYDKLNSFTELLLVHSSKYPGELPDFSCGMGYL